jgi:NAD(P)H-dependent flavin oxidoreductase YrpB (nitropropane dioxygenase family)
MKMAEGKPSLLQALSSALQIKRMIDVPLFKLFLGGLTQRSVQDLARQAINITAIKIAVESGDLETGVLPMSQAIGLIKDLPTCKEVMERTVAEAKELIEVLKECVL